MAGLLMPIGQCSKFLVKDVAYSLFQQAIKKAFNFISNLEEKHLRSQVSKFS